MTITGRKILITGGASGLGLGMARRFVGDGNTVIVCGRRRDALERAAGEVPELLTRPVDLSTERERDGFFDWIEKEHGDLNVLVNNAGIQQWMRPTDADFYPRAMAEIAINLEAPLHLTRRFLSLSDAQLIMNVSSGLGFVPLARVPVYCATKAFLHSFTLSLRYLMRERGIRVVEIIPPALDTDLGGVGIHEGSPAVADFVSAMFDQLDRDVSEITFGFTERIGRAGPDEIAAVFKRMNPDPVSQ